VHVWYGGAIKESLHALALLSLEERERYDGIRNLAARASYCSAHVGLRRVFADYLCVDAQSIRFARSPCPRCHDTSHGQPLVAWPKTDLTFSLSHSGDRWLVAVTGGGPIGADLERCPDRDLILSIREILTSDEQRALEQLPCESERSRFLLRAWTRKEAVCKALGVGLVADIRRLDVSPWKDGPVCLVFGLDGNDAIGWNVVDVPIGEGEFAAVARPHGHPIRLFLREAMRRAP